MNRHPFIKARSGKNGEKCKNLVNVCLNQSHFQSHSKVKHTDYTQYISSEIVTKYITTRFRAFLPVLRERGISQLNERACAWGFFFFDRFVIQAKFNNSNIARFIIFFLNAKFTENSESAYPYHNVINCLFVIIQRPTF